MTRALIRVIERVRPQHDIIMLAAGILSRNGIIVAPTETKYGLMANIDDESSIERLFELKQRAKDIPTAVFVRSRAQIGKFGEENDISRRLAECFLPGPLTIVLKACCSYPPPVVVDNKVGIRYSSSPVVREILGQSNLNLTATSANISKGGEPEAIEEIVSLFGDKIDLYLDAGPLGSISSTVIDCTGKNYKILRSGAISDAEMAAALKGN